MTLSISINRHYAECNYTENDRHYYQLIYFQWRHDTQHNGIQNNDALHIVMQCYYSECRYSEHCGASENISAGSNTYHFWAKWNTAV
jgi:hypothetical protein